jgi:hypothetical protein
MSQSNPNATIILQQKKFFKVSLRGKILENKKKTSKMLKSSDL